MSIDKYKYKTSEESDRYVWKPFILRTSLILFLFLFSIYIAILFNNEHLIKAELKTMSLSYFNSIVLTRKWNAQYGGVYIEKRPGIESNPYLENPDIQTIDGIIYTKKNPALMTREISELADENGNYQFHMTSLKPINPDNAPDEFEKKALESFEKGSREAFLKETIDNKSYFRYMRPLYIEKTCLECHGKQGYKVGDVRGGISVRFDISDVENKLVMNRYILIVLFILTAAVLIWIIYLIIMKLRKNIFKAQEEIEKLVITDGMTKLHNRRYFFERSKKEYKRSKRFSHPISCIMMDIDFFKNINDNHGHGAGDLVIKAIARILKDNHRESDLVARYGGEEFVLLLAETDQKGALTLAENMRSLIESNRVVIDDQTELKVTASFGVAAVSQEKLSEYDDCKELIAAADKALYKAKRNGRNRIECA